MEELAPPKTNLRACHTDSHTCSKSVGTIQKILKGKIKLLKFSSTCIHIFKSCQEDQTKVLFESVSEKLSQAGLKVRAEKCRYLVIYRRGKIQRRDLRKEINNGSFHVARQATNGLFIHLEATLPWRPMSFVFMAASSKIDRRNDKLSKTISFQPFFRLTF